MALGSFGVSAHVCRYLLFWSYDMELLMISSLVVLGRLRWQVNPIHEYGMIM